MLDAEHPGRALARAPPMRRRRAVRPTAHSRRGVVPVDARAAPVVRTRRSRPVRRVRRPRPSPRFASTMRIRGVVGDARRTARANSPRIDADLAGLVGGRHGGRVVVVRSPRHGPSRLGGRRSMPKYARFAMRWAPISWVRCRWASNSSALSWLSRCTAYRNGDDGASSDIGLPSHRSRSGPNVAAPSIMARADRIDRSLA